MKARVGPKFAILTALMLLLEVIPREAAAKVQQLCVDPSDASCSSTIQDAVNEAKGSAVVTVVAGTFTENVTINYAKAKALTLTIAGAGVGSTIIDGGNDGHVFYVGPKTTLTLSGLTIQDGNTGENGVGGGLYSLSAAITIENCLITGNNADIGGGLYLNGGSLNLVGSTVSNNTAYTPYSNITLVESYELGGGMYFRGNKLTITNSTFTGNTANTGGGMMLVSGTTTIHGSTISDNSANPIVPPGGGGVFIGAEGGGIFVGKSSLTMLNSTISGNAAVPVPAYLPGLGGAIENVKGTVTLNNVTIADNQATDGGAIRTTNGKSFTSGNSIIADNSSDDCEGTLDSKGYNLILDTSGCTIKGSTSTDVIGEDPILQPLALNAPGTTETQALTAGSPALKAANPAKPNGIDGHCLPTDQRGVTRPKGACDIGAFQLSN